MTGRDPISPAAPGDGHIFPPTASVGAFVSTMIRGQNKNYIGHLGPSLHFIHQNTQGEVRAMNGKQLCFTHPADRMADKIWIRQMNKEKVWPAARQISSGCVRDRDRVGCVVPWPEAEVSLKIEPSNDIAPPASGSRIFKMIHGSRPSQMSELFFPNTHGGAQTGIMGHRKNRWHRDRRLAKIPVVRFDMVFRRGQPCEHRGMGRECFARVDRVRLPTVRTDLQLLLDPGRVGRL